MSQLFTGDPDADRLILLSLPLSDVFSACQSSVYLSSICKDEDFWSRRTAQDFGPEVLRYKPQNESYSAQYRFLSDPAIGPKALANSRLDYVISLINKGFSMETIASYSFRWAYGPKAIIKLLIEKGWVPERGSLVDIINKDDPELLNMLEQRGIEVGLERVYTAARWCSLKSLEWLYQKYSRVNPQGFSREFSSGYSDSDCQKKLENWARSKGIW